MIGFTCTNCNCENDPIRMTCAECGYPLPDLDSQLEVDNSELDFDPDEDLEEFIERDGMTFCGACGIMACPGNEEFDWCDHITGDGCSYFEDDNVFADRDPEDWGYGE